jgi:hypothetical protein
MSAAKPTGPKPSRLFRPLTVRQSEVLNALVERYHREATQAAKARLYYAACTLIGSALGVEIPRFCGHPR